MRMPLHSSARSAPVLRRLALPLLLGSSAAAAQLMALPEAHALNLGPCVQVTPGVTADGCIVKEKSTGVSWLIKTTAAAAFGDGTSVDGNNLTDPNVAPWWSGDVSQQSAAESFARSVSAALGFGPINNPFYPGTPFFAFANGPGNSVSIALIELNPNSPPKTYSVNSSDAYKFAYARRLQDVPGPVPFLGAAAAFGYSRKLKKRIKAR